MPFFRSKKQEVIKLYLTKVDYDNLVDLKDALEQTYIECFRLAAELKCLKESSRHWTNSLISPLVHEIDTLIFQIKSILKINTAPKPNESTAQVCISNQELSKDYRYLKRYGLNQRLYVSISSLQPPLNQGQFRTPRYIPLSSVQITGSDVRLKPMTTLWQGEYPRDSITPSSNISVTSRCDTVHTAHGKIPKAT